MSVGDQAGWESKWGIYIVYMNMKVLKECIYYNDDVTVIHTFQKDSEKATLAIEELERVILSREILEVRNYRFE